MSAEHGMIHTAQTHADHQQRRPTVAAHPVGEIDMGAQRYMPAARAFDHDPVAGGRQAGMAVIEHLGINRHPRLGRGDMRGNGLGKRDRIDGAVVPPRRARGL